LFFDAFKPAAFQGGVLGVLDRVFHAALTIRIGHTGRISHNVVGLIWGRIFILDK